MSDIRDIFAINEEAMRLGAEQERRRIREGAVERVTLLVRQWAEKGAPVRESGEFAARIVEAVLGKGGA